MGLSANTVWEIRQDGDDNNGGGYVSDAGTTDYSQQAAAQLSVSDGATSGTGVTTLTSATGGFTAQMVGSIVHLYSGTNLTAGWYEISGYTDTNTVTLDRAPDDGVGGVSGATCKVGGALASIGGLGAVFSTADEAVAGMLAFMKYSASDYALSSTSANAAGGSLDLNANSMNGRRFALIGYDTTRTRGNTDENRPRIDVNGQALSNGAVIELDATTTDDAQLVANLIIDGDSQNLRGIAGDNVDYCNAVNVECQHCDGGSTFYKVHAYRCKAYHGAGDGFQQCMSMFCWADANGDEGFY